MVQISEPHPFIPAAISCRVNRRMLNRRTFLASSSGLYAVNASPNSTVTLGVIGAGGRGSFVMAAFARNPNLQIAAICDVYEPNLKRGISAASEEDRRKPRAYRSFPSLANG